MRSLLSLTSLILVFLNTSCAQKKPSNKTTAEVPIETIKWYTFQEAVELNKTNPKKLFIDVYTEWCGWCKKMDASTFTDPVVIKTMNKYYYAIKMDAEMNDTIVFQNTTFVNPEPTKKRSTHQLANALLNGQLGYPTSIYLDENYNMLSPVAGYQTPEAIEPILVFFGENKHKTEKYEDFVKTYESQVNLKTDEKKDTISPIEKMPEFPGGTVKLIEYLQKNIKYPKDERKKGTEGKVYVKFTISKDGDVMHSKVVRSVPNEVEAFTKEALRVVNNMPKWIPGEQDHKKVAVEFTLPINFTLQSTNKQ